MVKIAEINQSELEEWLTEKPQVIKDMAAQCPPGRLYKMKSTGHRVTLVSYSEDRTVKVFVGGKYNAVGFERSVFGISINDLEECDLPDPDEPVGSLDMTTEEVKAYLKESSGELIVGDA